MEAVYKKILETFNAHPEVFTNLNLPTIRTIDINIGQPDNPEDFEIFLPGMFISWNINPGLNGENDTLLIDFHIVQEPGTPTDNFTPTLDAGLEYLNLIKAVRYLLNRLKCEHTTPLKYAGERQAVTQFFRYHIISYTCGIEQYLDSFWRGKTTDGTIESLKIEKSQIKNLEPVGDIDIY